MVRRVVLPLALAALVASAPAWSVNVFKWIDDKGVVNYTTEPPPPATKAVQVNASPAVELRFSSADEEARYWREKRLRESARDADDRRLRRETEEWRQAQIRQQMMAAQQRTSSETLRQQQLREQCLRERRVDCDGNLSPAPAVIVVPRVRQTIQQASPFPVGGNSIGGIATGMTAGTQSLLGTRTTAIEAPAAARVATRR